MYSPKYQLIFEKSQLYPDVLHNDEAKERARTFQHDNIHFKKNPKLQSQSQ